MKDLKERITEISEYLQRLLEPSIYPSVQKAVQANDRDKLSEICRKLKIPPVYISTVIFLVLSVSPEQAKWPLPEF